MLAILPIWCNLVTICSNFSGHPMTQASRPPPQNAAGAHLQGIFYHGIFLLSLMKADLGKEGSNGDDDGD